MKFGVVVSFTFIICLNSCVINSESIKKDIAYILNRCEPNNLNLKTKSVILNNNFGELKLKLHVANTPNELQTGLMCIKGLDKGIDGMMFEFQTLQDKAFWMYKTIMPLQIVYFNEFNESVGNFGMKPCSKKILENQNVWTERCLAESSNYIPQSNYLYAIEIIESYEDIDKLKNYLHKEKLNLLRNN
jgi:uncharacterized membrane protein (UPF0127 family)